MKHLPNLYLLRLLLAVLVIIHHIPLICITFNVPYYNALPIFDKGEQCVYYFFSLSGFLILRLIYSELTATQRFNFKNFYLRRIQRLYPAYYLVFFIGLVLYHFILPKMGVAYKGNYSLPTLFVNYIFFIPNVFKYYYKAGSILLILWSIGVEEQFYLFIPLFMFFLRKRLVAGILILFSILLLLLLVFPSFYLYQNFYFYFLSGGLLSVISLKRRIGLFQNKAFHIVVYILFGLSFFTNWFVFNNQFLYHTFNLVISGLLITLISDYPIFIVENKVIDYLGKISYGVYVYHAIVITGALFLVNKFKPYNSINHAVFIVLLNLIIISLSLLVAHISFKYFESRFYKSKH